MLIRGNIIIIIEFIYRICEESQYEQIIEVINEVREALEEFDLNWVTYE